LEIGGFRGRLGAVVLVALGRAKQRVAAASGWPTAKAGSSEGNSGDGGDGGEKKKKKEDKQWKGLAQNYCY
jgi:hypothetical protein